MFIMTMIYIHIRSWLKFHPEDEGDVQDISRGNSRGKCRARARIPGLKLQPFIIP